MLNVNTRIASGVAALTIAAATAAPAAARPLGSRDAGSPLPTEVSAPSVQAVGHHGGDSFEWGYVAGGAGAASLALIAIGATVSGRRQRRSHRSPTAA
jgi:hypothetical protein